MVLEGLLVPRSASRAILVLARSKAFKLVLAEYVRREIEDHLLHLIDRDAAVADEIIDAYVKLLHTVTPEAVPLPTREEIDRHRHLIRHQTDVPVLVSAIRAAPDHLVTTNTRHFTVRVATRTKLSIVTPRGLLAKLGSAGRPASS
ncbi:MAG: PIN domain-containing protein [Deltaproteobacteria bacterium]|nr:PIN domain-containing protein [Deltaproteobacteria bacterium]